MISMRGSGCSWIFFAKARMVTHFLAAPLSAGPPCVHSCRATVTQEVGSPAPPANVAKLTKDLVQIPKCPAEKELSDISRLCISVCD